MTDNSGNWTDIITAVTPVALALIAIWNLSIQNKSRERYKDSQEKIKQNREAVKEAKTTLDKVEDALYKSEAINGPYKEKRTGEQQVQWERRRRSKQRTEDLEQEQQQAVSDDLAK